MTAAILCLVIAVVCEVVAAFPTANARVNFMPLGFAFGFLSLIVGHLSFAS